MGASYCVYIWTLPCSESALSDVIVYVLYIIRSVYLSFSTQQQSMSQHFIYYGTSYQPAGRDLSNTASTYCMHNGNIEIFQNPIKPAISCPHAWNCVTSSRACPCSWCHNFKHVDTILQILREFEIFQKSCAYSIRLICLIIITPWSGPRFIHIIHKYLKIAEAPQKTTNRRNPKL